MLTTWRKELEEELAKNRESWDDVEATAPGIYDRWLDEEFDPSYGSANGSPFTLWTARRVYFPVCYDGAEWVGSVSRHPCREPSPHYGGGQDG